MIEESRGGCFLALAAIIVILVLAAAIISGLGNLEDSQAQRLYAAAENNRAWGQARSAIIEAQGQARMDSAQAIAVILMSALPWLVVMLIAIAGISLLAIVLAMVILAMGFMADRRETLLIATAMRPALPGPVTWPILTRQALVIDDAIFSKLER